MITICGIYAEILSQRHHQITATPSLIELGLEKCVRSCGVSKVFIPYIIGRVINWVVFCVFYEKDFIIILIFCQMIKEISNFR